MRKTIHAELDAPATRVGEVLRDLTTYPDWLDIVDRVEPAAPADGDAGPAWLVTLRAKVGPLARSKRLRMVRTLDQAAQLRFERRELDGRRHAAWVLRVAIDGSGPCSVDVELRYDGSFWTAPLDVILGSQADDAVPRLQSLVAG